MAKKIKAAIIGDKNEVALYGAAGVRVCDATNAKDAQKELDRLVDEGYGLIFMTETLYRECEAKIKKYLEVPYPIITAVPCRGSDGSYSQAKIAENVKKALGSDII